MLLKNARIYSIHFRKERDLYVLLFGNGLSNSSLMYFFSIFCIRNWDETVETEPLIIFTLFLYDVRRYSQLLFHGWQKIQESLQPRRICEGHVEGCYSLFLVICCFKNFQSTWKVKCVSWNFLNECFGL